MWVDLEKTDPFVRFLRIPHDRGSEKESRDTSGILPESPRRFDVLTNAERRERQRVVAQLQRDSRRLAYAFRLPLRGLEAERANVSRRYGVCYSDGSVRIRLRHAKTGRLLKYSSLVDTLCHELAHLRYFNHGARFQVFYRSVLDHARKVGIYRPSPRRSGRAEPERRAPAHAQLQLDLFAVGIRASGSPAAKTPGSRRTPRGYSAPR